VRSALRCADHSIFDQPHGHLAYDSGEFKAIFLRPVMRSAKGSLEAHFFLASRRVRDKGMRLAQGVLIWAVLAAAIGVPSPLQWQASVRLARPIYILAGFAGIIALVSCVQPVLIAGYTGTIGLSRTSRALLDWRSVGRGSIGPRRGPLDHQSAGHD
jgi:hypothetical protein